MPSSSPPFIPSHLSPLSLPFSIILYPSPQPPPTPEHYHPIQVWLSEMAIQFMVTWHTIAKHRYGIWPASPSCFTWLVERACSSSTFPLSLLHSFTPLWQRQIAKNKERMFSAHFRWVFPIGNGRPTISLLIWNQVHTIHEVLPKCNLTVSGVKVSGAIPREKMKGCNVC